MTEVIVIIIFLLVVASIAFYALHNTYKELDKQAHHNYMQSLETTLKIERLIQQIQVLEDELNRIKEATAWVTLKDMDEP